jgi:lauroyl/myristoyl acyltransferase
MSVGSYLLTEQNMALVRSKSWKFGRPLIVESGLRYYDNHPADVQRIVDNLSYMGLPASGQALDDVLRETIAHYYEKLFVLVKGYEAFWIARNRIDFGASLEVFSEAKSTSKGVFIGQAHFGATYLMASALMVNGISLSAVGLFPEPVGSLLKQGIRTLTERYGAAPAKILNLADPSQDVPVEMITRMVKGEVVSNVYDENNRFSKPVELLGRRIMGGTGMDLILRRFTDDRLIVVTPFLVRTSDETFRYELDRHYLSDGDIITGFYASLERRVRADPAQWYFIHELHESFATAGE